MSLATRLLNANPGVQVSDALTGSLTTPSAKQAFIFPTSFESIATLTPTSGSTAEFTSIPATYRSLHIRLKFMTASTIHPSITLRFNNNSSTFYSNRALGGNGSTVDAVSYNAVNRYAWGDYSGSVVSLSQNVGTLDIINYASTTHQKTIRSVWGQNQNTSDIYNYIQIGTGLWTATDAINSIQFTVSGGEQFATGTSIALYGVK